MGKRGAIRQISSIPHIFRLIYQTQHDMMEKPDKTRWRPVDDGRCSDYMDKKARKAPAHVAAKRYKKKRYSKKVRAAAITGVSGPLGYPMLKLCPALQIQRMASIIAEGILLAASQAPAPPLPAARQMTACAGAAAAFCAYPTPIKNGTEG